MRDVTTVIVVKTAKVFDRLGHMPILNWTLLRLKETRGVGRLLCVASADLTSRAKQVLADEEIEVLPLPVDLVKKNDEALDKWLCAGPCSTSSVVAVCSPTTPFLPSAKIEACIDVVSRNLAESAATAQKVQAHTAEGRKTAHVEVPGCRAFLGTRFKDKKTALRFRAVAVTLTEMLDIALPDHHRLAAALVASGDV